MRCRLHGWVAVTQEMHSFAKVHYKQEIAHSYATKKIVYVLHWTRFELQGCLPCIDVNDCFVYLLYAIRLEL